LQNFVVASNPVVQLDMPSVQSASVWHGSRHAAVAAESPVHAAGAAQTSVPGVHAVPSGVIGTLLYVQSWDVALHSMPGGVMQSASVVQPFEQYDCGCCGSVTQTRAAHWVASVHA
jgi:hypothetical protein